MVVLMKHRTCLRVMRKNGESNGGANGNWGFTRMSRLEGFLLVVSRKLAVTGLW